MARTPNTIKTSPLTVSITPAVKDYLEQLTNSGLWGKNAAETANLLISDRIRYLLSTGEIQPKPNDISE